MRPARIESRFVVDGIVIISERDTVPHPDLDWRLKLWLPLPIWETGLPKSGLGVPNASSVQLS